MLALSPTRRDHVFLAGTICLIMGGAMLLVHLLFRPVKPKRFETAIPAQVTQASPASKENPAWAPVQKHGNGQKDSASAFNPFEKNVTSGSQQGSIAVIPSPFVTVPNTLVQVQVEDIVGDNKGMDIYFRVIGSGNQGIHPCGKWDSTRSDSSKNYVTDDKGHRSNATLFPWGGCPELAQGEVKRFHGIYQPLDLSTGSLVVHYGELYSPSISIPVQLRR